MSTLSSDTSIRSLGQISRGSLAEQVAVILKRFILMEDLQEGDRLPPERDLTVMLDVSQRVVREALGLLAGEGLIVKRHGRGAFVQAMDRERLRAELVIPSTQFPSIRDLHEARCALEIGAMYVAAQHATEDDIRKLEDVLDSMAGALRDEKILLPDDLRFHLTLLEVTHNDTLRSLAFMISESIRQNVYLKPGMLRRRLEDESHVLSAHRTIVDALSEGDGTKAALAMHMHLRRTLEGELDA